MTNTLQVKLLSENARMPNEIIRRMQVMTYSQLKLSYWSHKKNSNKNRCSCKHTRAMSAVN